MDHLPGLRDPAQEGGQSTMNLEIDEFREIIDGEWPGGAIQGRKPNEDEMRRTLQVMLTRQCIYSSTPGLGRTYEIVRAYASFFERFFGTLGYRLVISPRDQMVEGGLPLRRHLRTPSQGRDDRPARAAPPLGGGDREPGHR
jgi:hypothetical protein